MARCATRKTDTAINRIKTLGPTKPWTLRKTNWQQTEINRWDLQTVPTISFYGLCQITKKNPSPHIPYKNLEYEQKEKIQHDFLPV